MGIMWLVAAAVFGADFLIKTFLRANFAFQSIPVIKNIFHITVVFNKGAAFGILQGKTSFLIYAGVIFILAFLLIIKKESKKSLPPNQTPDKSGDGTGLRPARGATLFFVACGLIIGGALSNLYDRIFLGFVVDYLDFRVWPVFNLSDSCLNIGVVLLLWETYRKPK